MHSVYWIIQKILRQFIAFRKIIILQLTIAGIIVYPAYLWGYAFLYYYLFLLPVICTVYHDYLAHGYIKPKNKIIEYVSFFIFVFYMTSDLRNKKLAHMAHHKYNSFAPDKDPVVQSIKSATTWRFLLDLMIVPPQKKPHGKEDSTAFLNKIDQGPVSDSVWIFFNKYWLILSIITHIIWLGLFPVWTWFIFYVYPTFLGNVTGRLSEVWFHKWNKQDHWLFILLQGSQGWHRSHHETHTNPIVGPRPWEYENTKLNSYFKYLNTQFYIITFFYTPVVKHAK